MTALRLTRESFTTLLGELGSVMKHNFNHKVLARMQMLLAQALTVTVTVTVTLTLTLILALSLSLSVRPNPVTYAGG